MEIICNGNVRNMEPERTVLQLLDDLSLDPVTVVVECDGRVLPREEYVSHQLRDGSIVELIRFVGGG